MTSIFSALFGGRPSIPPPPAIPAPPPPVLSPTGVKPGKQTQVPSLLGLAAAGGGGSEDSKKGGGKSLLGQ